MMEGEEGRMDEALACRKLTPKDVVSVVWNTRRNLYVVWFRKK